MLVGPLLTQTASTEWAAAAAAAAPPRYSLRKASSAAWARRAEHPAPARNQVYRDGDH